MKTIAQYALYGIVTLLALRLAATALVSYGAVFVFFMVAMFVVTSVGAYYFARGVIKELDKGE